MPTQDPLSAPSGASPTHAFTPQAIMARASAHGIEQAARAAKFDTVSHLPAAEVLDALAAGIERAACAAPNQPGISGLVDRPSAEALLASIARELDGGPA